MPLRKEKHHFWKGEKASYGAKHIWMKNNHGKANKCENNPKHKGFFEWANLSGKYLRKRSDWKMLCHSCNQRGDYIRRNGNKCKRGHKYTKENTAWTKRGSRDCKACRREKQREWKINHPNYYKSYMEAYGKSYYLRNKEEILKQSKIRYAKRLK